MVWVQVVAASLSTARIIAWTMCGLEELPYTNLWELLYTVSLLYLEHLRRLPLARQQLPDSNPAGLVCQPHLYML